MISLWIKVMKHHRIVRNETVEMIGNDVEVTLREKLQEMDLPAPIWLNKHEKEFEQFRMTSFAPGDFVEHVSFDKIDVAMLDGVKRKSSDPRNEF